MWKRLVGALVALGVISSAWAGFPTLLGVGRPPVAAGGSYTGPGDIVASASGWWGLRAYNAAYATGSNPAADICIASTGLSCTTINILADGSFDVATASASTACAVQCAVKELYDQSGHSNHLFNTGGIANAPVIVFNCIGSLPCMSFNGTTDFLISNSITAIPQPTSTSAVAKRTGNFSGFSSVVGGDGGAGILFNNSTNTATVYCGATGVTVSAADSSFHALQGVCNGASSVIAADGASAAGNAGASDTSTQLSMGGLVVGSLDRLTGNITEGGLWPSAFSGANITSLNGNQHTYWGF